MMAHLSGTPPPSSLAHQKQYVFVDEYNRSKRLKVMRACDGCRKRKIRCDGALQNGPWPCGACLRLKLKCVPPTLDQDEDGNSTPDSAQSQHSFSFQSSTFPTSAPAPTPRQNGVTSHPQAVGDWTPVTTAKSIVTTPTSATASHSDFDTGPYAANPYQPLLGPRLGPDCQGDEYFASAAAPAQFQQPGHQVPPSLLRTQTTVSSASSGDPQEIDATVRELSEHMGDLQIDITSEAPYIANQKRAVQDAPALEEADVILPPSVYTDSTICIPDEMMPSEERAMDYFGYYFEHVHAYCPVLNRAQFYDQWRNARSSISPLILEGVFACVARYIEEPIVARKWLALASKHEESFKDVPRLSTIQAMIILMKARESLTQRGYYYRSWMAVKYMTTMGFDLDLHEHRDKHRPGETCGLSKADCMVHTRIWQTMFHLEILVGSPQGRTDFSIEIDTVELELPLPSSDVDAFEHQMSRRSTSMSQAVCNIKQSSRRWLQIRKLNEDWALDPEFVRHNEDLPVWLHNLPADMQIHYPSDGSPPWLGGDHYLASLHAYHHLVVIIHHRPQLQALLVKRDPGFKVHLDTCLISAVLMCRLQEALYRDFGLHGLQFMTRGINFTIYCVLTCTMLHLAAITSPDPLLNSQARTFFARHMRILEHCAESANPEVAVQISTLREAFSADTSKPFELKPTLGLRSPSPSNHSTPPSTNSGPISSTAHPPPAWSAFQDTTASKVLTPTSEYSHAYDQVAPQGTAMAAQLPYDPTTYDIPPHTAFTNQSLPALNTTTQTGYALEASVSNETPPPVWDPSGIFNNWNHAFGGGQPAPRQATFRDPRAVQPTSAPMLPQHQTPPTGHDMYSAQLQQQIAMSASPVDRANPAALPTVTPVMWQDAFTNAYVSGHGQKRYREASIDHSAYANPANQYKRRG